MTLYGGYLFYICLIFALLPAIALGVLQKPLRFYTLGISIGFICMVLADDIQQFLCFIGFFLAELALIKGYQRIRIRYGRNEKLYYGAEHIAACFK